MFYIFINFFFFQCKKKQADILENQLRQQLDGKATAIHGDMAQWEREMSLSAFKDGSRPILVATDVAARGLDISQVSHVVNYDMSTHIDDHVHRIGRTVKRPFSKIRSIKWNKNGRGERDTRARPSRSSTGPTHRSPATLFASSTRTSRSCPSGSSRCSTSAARAARTATGTTTSRARTPLEVATLALKLSSNSPFFLAFFY